jgi:3-phenylpropionate/cinnamic acid dioxygenase small subunit
VTAVEPLAARTGPALTPEVRDAVEDLYAEYVDLLDTGEFERWAELFTDDCLYLVIAKENHDRGLPLGLIRCESRGMLDDRVQAIRRLSMYAPRVVRHLVGNLRVRPFAADRGDAAETTTARVVGGFEVSANYAVFQTLHDADTTVLSTGRYVDLVVPRDGALAFARKLCVYDNPLVPNSLVQPI